MPLEFDSAGFPRAPRSPAEAALPYSLPPLEPRMQLESLPEQQLREAFDACCARAEPTASRFAALIDPLREDTANTPSYAVTLTALLEERVEREFERLYRGMITPEEIAPFIIFAAQVAPPAAEHQASGEGPAFLKRWAEIGLDYLAQLDQYPGRFGELTQSRYAAYLLCWRCAAERHDAGAPMAESLRDSMAEYLCGIVQKIAAAPRYALPFETVQDASYLLRVLRLASLLGDSRLSTSLAKAAIRIDTLCHEVVSEFPDSDDALERKGDCPGDPSLADPTEEIPMEDRNMLLVTTYRAVLSALATCQYAGTIVPIWRSLLTRPPSSESWSQGLIGLAAYDVSEAQNYFTTLLEGAAQRSESALTTWIEILGVPGGISASVDVLQGWDSDEIDSLLESARKYFHKFGPTPLSFVSRISNGEEAFEHFTRELGREP